MTVRAYYLETETIDGTDRMIGESIITNALVQSEDNLRKVNMDTTTTQHNALKAVAKSNRTAYPEEEAELRKTLFPTPTPSLQQQVDDLKVRVTTLEAAAKVV